MVDVLTLDLKTDNDKVFFISSVTSFRNLGSKSVVV